MSEKKYIFPAMGNVYAKLEPYTILLLRITVGIILVSYGWGKVNDAFFGEGLGNIAGIIERNGLPFPLLLAWLTMITESVGGFCIIFGLFTRLWAFIAAFMMSLIILFIKDPTVFSTFSGGFDFELAIIIILTVIFILGGGKISIDSKLTKEF